MITVLFFAGLREALGTSSETLVLPAGVGSIASLCQHLAARGAPWDALTTTRNLRAAVNQEMAKPEAAIKDGDEIAFFPPVTGG